MSIASIQRDFNWASQRVRLFDEDWRHYEEKSNGVVRWISDLIGRSGGIREKIDADLKIAKANLAEAKVALEEKKFQEAFVRLKNIERQVNALNALWKDYAFYTEEGAEDGAILTVGLAFGGGLLCFGNPIGLVVASTTGLLVINNEDKDYEKNPFSPPADKNELINQAKKYLKNWDSNVEPSSTFEWGPFLIETEITDERELRHYHYHRYLKETWAQTKNELEGAILLGGGEGDSMIEGAIQYLYDESLPLYTAPLAQITNYLEGKGSDCEGQTKMVSALFHDLQARLPKGYVLGVQVFKDHVVPVIYNQRGKKGEWRVWDLISQKKLEGVVSRIYYPEIILHAYLKKQGEESPVTKTRLVLAEPTVTKKETPHTSPDTNSNLEFPLENTSWYQKTPPPLRDFISSPFPEKAKERLLDDNDPSFRVGYLWEPAWDRSISFFTFSPRDRQTFIELQTMGARIQFLSQLAQEILEREYTNGMDVFGRNSFTSLEVRPLELPCPTGYSDKVTMEFHWNKKEAYLAKRCFGKLAKGETNSDVVTEFIRTD